MDASNRMQVFHLHFQGSVSDTNRSCLPSYQGVYLVYRGVWSEKEKLFYCHEIMYIGQAENINQRHQTHERRSDFLARCRQGEIVFYSYAAVPAQDIDCVESALIFHVKPVLNNVGEMGFHYPATRVVSDGACALLDGDFSVEQSA